MFDKSYDVIYQIIFAVNLCPIKWVTLIRLCNLPHFVSILIFLAARPKRVICSNDSLYKKEQIYGLICSAPPMM